MEGKANLGHVQAGGDPSVDATIEWTVSDVVVDVLADAGTQRIYGITGDALNGFVDALRKDGRIEWVGVRHEESAAFAAYADSEITGGLGVCAGSVGPGALHLLNGLYNAKREGAAVVAITGQVSRELKGRSYFQEVDLFKVFDDVCGMQVALEDPSQLPLTVELAVRRAISDREVVRIELPVDVTTLKAPRGVRSRAIGLTKAPVEPEEQALAAAVSILDEAQRVAILAGAGCRAAKAEVLRLAEHLSAPIIQRTSSTKARSSSSGQRDSSACPPPTTPSSNATRCSCSAPASRSRSSIPTPPASFRSTSAPTGSGRGRQSRRDSWRMSGRQRRR